MRLPPACLQFDYLARDSLYCGVKVACHFNRIIQFSKVGPLAFGLSPAAACSRHL